MSWCGPSEANRDTVSRAQRTRGHEQPPFNVVGTRKKHLILLAADLAGQKEDAQRSSSKVSETHITILELKTVWVWEPTLGEDVYIKPRSLGKVVWLWSCRAPLSHLTVHGSALILL
jgi:hypothetical protein